jgi:hypothetical protein
MIIQPIDFAPLIENPFDASESLDIALALIEVFVIVFLQRRWPTKWPVFFDSIHSLLQESVYLTSRDNLVENQSIVIHRPGDLAALPNYLFPNKRIPAKISVAIFELAFLKSEFFAAICEDFFSAFSAAGIGIHFGFDEELFEFHCYPPVFDVICETAMTLRLTVDNS